MASRTIKAVKAREQQLRLEGMTGGKAGKVAASLVTGIKRKKKSSKKVGGLVGDGRWEGGCGRFVSGRMCAWRSTALQASMLGQLSNGPTSLAPTHTRCRPAGQGGRPRRRPVQRRRARQARLGGEGRQRRGRRRRHQGVRWRCQQRQSQGEGECRRRAGGCGGRSQGPAVLQPVPPALCWRVLDVQGPRGGTGLGKSELNRVKRGGKGTKSFKSKAKHRRR